MNCKPHRRRTLAAALCALALTAGELSAYYRHPTSDDLITPPDRACSRPAPSPDGKQMAYVVESSGQKQIWVRQLEGASADRRLSDGQASDDSPDWSPDGRHLYFSADRGGASKIWRLELDSGKRRQITFGMGNDFHPRVSPDGRQIAFDSNRQGNYDVWLQDLASGRATRLSEDPAGDFAPAWSPDGGQIAFSSSRGGQFNVWLQDVALKLPARPLTSGPGNSAHPDWSPDGRRIAFDSDRGAGKTKVYVQPLEGTAPPQPVTDLLSLEEHPRFSRDGKRIFFSARENQLAGAKSKPVPAAPESTAAPEVASAPPAEAPAPAAASTAGAGGKMRVLQFFPGSVPGGVDPATPIAAVFDRQLARAQPLRSVVRLWEGATTMSVEVSYNPSLRRLELLPDLPLRHGQEYRVGISSDLKAADGGALESPFFWKFRTAEREAPRPEPVMQVGTIRNELSVAGSRPRDHEGGVEAGAKVHVDFSLPIDPGSLDANAIRLLTESGEPVPGEIYFPPGDYALELTPYTPMRPGTVHVVQLSDRLRSREGAVLTGSRALKFRTAFTGPLRVASVEPTGPLGPKPRLQVRFNRRVAAETVRSGKVLLQGESFPYPGAAELAPSGDLLTFEPYQGLPPGQTFKLFLPVGLTDPDGNPLELDGPIELRTAERAAGAPETSAPLGLLQRRDTPEMDGNAPRPPELGRYLSHANGGGSATVEPWVVRDLGALASKGHLEGDFDQDLRLQGGLLSRHRAALHVREAFRAMPQMKPPDRDRLLRLARSLAPELQDLGVRVGATVVRGSSPPRRLRQQGPSQAIPRG